MSAALRLVVAGQAVFYLTTGAWPLVSLSSFEAVTGPKTDDWLVHMVALLIIVTGAALGVAAWRGTALGPPLFTLAVGAPVAFIVVDLVYALNGTISRIYLADALVESGLIVALLAAWRLSRPTVPGSWR